MAVRRPLASSLAALAAIIGPAQAAADLRPVLERFLDDPDQQVRMAAVDSLADMASLLPHQDQLDILAMVHDICTDPARPWPVVSSVARSVVGSQT